MTEKNRRRFMDRKIVEQLVTGKSFNGVCRDLKVGRNRVSHIRELAREYGYLEGSRAIPVYPEALFPDPEDGRTTQESEADKQLQGQRGWIEERLLAGWQPISIYENRGSGSGLVSCNFETKLIKSLHGKTVKNRI